MTPNVESAAKTNAANRGFLTDPYRSPSRACRQAVPIEAAVGLICPQARSGVNESASLTSRAETELS